MLLAMMKRAESQVRQCRFMVEVLQFPRWFSRMLLSNQQTRVVEIEMEGDLLFGPLRHLFESKTQILLVVILGLVSGIQLER